MDQADAIYEIPERRAEARQLYAALAAKYPRDPIAPQALYMAGYAALAQGDYPAAAKQADAFLAAHAGHELVPDVTYVSAESKLQIGRFAEAEKLYAQLLEKYPQHADADFWKVRRGTSLHLQKKYPEVIASLQPLLAELRNPDALAEAHFLIGSSQVEQEQFAEAAKSLEASLAAQPKWRQADEVLLVLAQAYHRQSNDQKAREMLRRLIAEFPGSKLLDRAHYRLGEYSAGGQRSEDRGGRVPAGRREVAAKLLGAPRPVRAGLGAVRSERLRRGGEDVRRRCWRSTPATSWRSAPGTGGAWPGSSSASSPRRSTTSRPC